MRALLAAFLVVTCVTLSQSGVLLGSLERELTINQDRVQIVHDMLLEAKCSITDLKSKREEITKNIPAKLNVEKVYYERLLTLLIECQKENAEGSNSATTGKLQALIQR